MRRFWWVTTVLTVVLAVAVVALWFYLDRIGQRYRERLHEVRTRLHGLDEVLPFEPPARTDPARFDVYLGVRRAVTDVWRERESREHKALDHGVETRLAMLDALATALSQGQMSFREYRFLAGRYHAILARGADPAAPEALRNLLAAWRTTLRSSRYADGLPLPEPWKDAPAAEVALIVARVQPLMESMAADWLLHVLRDLGPGG
ncbi:MAG: hypothetical protein ACE5JG_05410 [Planctomycetota bacterium]